MIKENRRLRYIAFLVKTTGLRTHLTNTEVIEELRKRCTILFQKEWKQMGLWLIRFNGTEGIIRCHYREKDNMIHLLNSMKEIGMKKVEVTTLSTSGTIHGLTH